MTKTILGGIMIPNVPPTACIAAEYSLGYPRFDISGYINPPIAAVVATEDPDIAAKKVQASNDTREIPPEIHPTQESAKATSLLDKPPSDIMFPAKIKPGIANIEKLSAPVKMRWAMTTNGILSSKAMETMHEKASDHVIGNPIINARIKVNNKNIAG